MGHWCDEGTGQALTGVMLCMREDDLKTCDSSPGKQRPLGFEEVQQCSLARI